MLYACIKTGIQVPLSDLSMNVLFDLLTYSAETDSAVLDSANGGKRTGKPMSLAEMTKAGKIRG